MKLILLIALAAAFQSCNAANILAIMPFPSKSHGILLERLLKALTTNGHTVTYLTAAVPLKPLGDKVKILEVPNFQKEMMGHGGTTNINTMYEMTAWGYLTFLPKVGLFVSEKILSSDVVKKLMNSNEKFDLILADNFLQESIMAGFAQKNKAPLIAIQSFLPNFWANYMVGNPAPSSFIPDPFFPFDTKMTFFQRVENFLYGIVNEYYHTNIYLPKQEALMKTAFGSNTPSIHEILKNTSFVLVNHHHTLAYPRPYVPNMIEVAGMHIDEPKPLPADLQKYMDSSRDGVILFSLGSNLKSSDLPPEQLKGILKALGRLKQNVLWKFEVEISDLPKNVRVMKWVPQTDVLAHPNIKLFITHGGLLSTTESIHRGVPVVGIPFFGDQPLNMKQVENAGFGKTVKPNNVNEETLYNAITEVIGNPRYSEKAKEKSKLFKDNPMTPLDTALWWVEYVIRHKGAKHLRSAAQDLSWYELNLIDVYALALVIFLTTATVNIFIVKTILRKICGKKSKETSSKQNEKKKKNN